MPIRTCISCKDKQEQTKLNRFKCENKNIILYNGFGRSFYICDLCLKNKKQLEKALFRQCKNKAPYWEQLKEILTDE